MNKFIKQLFKATFIQLVAFFMIIGSLAVFALSYPTSNPSWEIPGGVFMNYLNKILVDTWSTTDWTVKKAEVLTTWCNEWEYLQWFDVDWNKICKSIADLANPISADEFSNDVSWWLNYSIISATTPCPAWTVDLWVRTWSINWLLNWDKDMLASWRDTPSTSADHYYFHTSNFNNFRAPWRLCGFNKNINYVIINSTTSCPAGTLDFWVRETTWNWIVIQPVKTWNTIALPRDTPSTSSNYYRDDTYTTSVACDSWWEWLCYTTVPVAYAFQAPWRLCWVDKSYKFIIIWSTEDCTTWLDFWVREITWNWLTSIDGKFTTVWDTPSTNSTYYSTDTDWRFRAPGRLCWVGKYTNFVILPWTYACPAGTINFWVREAVWNWLLKSKWLQILFKLNLHQLYEILHII